MPFSRVRDGVGPLSDAIVEAKAGLGRVDDWACFTFAAGTVEEGVDVGARHEGAAALCGAILLRDDDVMSLLLMGDVAISFIGDTASGPVWAL